MVKKAQFRIQQMALMIIALVFFFILVGLFFLGYQYKGVQSNFKEMQKEQAVSFLKVMRNMPEFSYASKDARAKSICLDWDKINIVASKSSNLSALFPVASIKVLKAFGDKKIPCPGENCNYYEIFNSHQDKVEEYETYACFCTKSSENSISYDKCRLGNVIVGIKK
jgi:hypothetical protein